MTPEQQTQRLMVIREAQQQLLSLEISVLGDHESGYAAALDELARIVIDLGTVGQDLGPGEVALA